MNHQRSRSIRTVFLFWHCRFLGCVVAPPLRLFLFFLLLLSVFESYGGVVLLLSLLLKEFHKKQTFLLLPILWLSVVHTPYLARLVDDGLIHVVSSSFGWPRLLLPERISKRYVCINCNELSVSLLSLQYFKNPLGSRYMYVLCMQCSASLLM